MKLSRSAWLKLLLVGTLAVTVAAVPEPVELSDVYANSSKAVVKSVSEIQHKLLAAMNSRESTVRFVYQGQTKSLKAQLKEALDQAMESDPYIQYTIASYSYDYRGTSSTADVTVRLSYRETAEQTAYVNRKVKEILKVLLKPGMNDHEKVKVINDWVILNLKYDTSLQKYTAYDGLSSGSTVCQGYSLLTYKLLKEAGIPNKIVEGTAYAEGNPGGQLHAWNLVLLDGKWYHLDTTWNDPVPNRDGEISYTYYLLTDAQMEKDHIWIKTYPKANTLYRNTLSTLVSEDSGKTKVYLKLIKDLEYHLYEKKGIVRTYGDLQGKVKSASKAGKSELLFRFDGKETDLLVVLQDLQRKSGVGSIRYYHSLLDETDDLKVHISW
ncbi:transglutaminase domain-containing protein [Paenibacillus dakarensis]|uniref:transglutaminase domain-containing protein n=1 Tax=Paenibacillus dakarensis TaxID=1527293 RepID=UPI0006D52D8C|nr:transglutaminase domain-containing protein [Paenibacillus dakarensis]